ncbi:MAG: DUF1588 domain-containing protein [Deltaproteobacteria bacterium]|nr:DUF1588 domain-containing protein [Deltaproteobacteria bacterium]
MRLPLCVLFAFVCACSGQVGNSQAGPDNQGSNGGSQGGAAGVGTNAAGGKPIEETKFAVTGGLQRITARQFTNTISDIFGAKFANQAVPELDFRSEGFATVGGRAVSVSSEGIRKYDDTAVRIATAVMADAGQRTTWITCTPMQPQDQTCMQMFVAKVGRRLFRRPLTSEETQRFAAVGTGAALAFKDFFAGARYALTGLLLSPKFLYHSEIGETTPQGSLLTPFERASRLSYLLWGTTPDEALLGAAEDRSLGNAVGLSRQLDRLLADKARLAEGLRGFADGYLGLYLLADAPKDLAKFPLATAATRAAMVQAVYNLFSEVLIVEGRPFADVFDPGYVFANQQTAAILGVTAPSDSFVRVKLPTDGLRVGLLTEPALLAARARQSETSPTLRGKFINELLCQEPPPPPANVNTTLGERTNGTTKRQQIEAHMQNPACAGCHKAMDPIGFGLENFDAMGAVQLKDNGAPINASGDLFDEAFAGPRELSRLVAKHDGMLPCLVRRLYTHALGHAPSADEEWVLTKLQSNAAATGAGQFVRLLRDIVMSPGFTQAPAL